MSADHRTWVEKLWCWLLGVHPNQKGTKRW
jgi:hypothetical protein